MGLRARQKLPETPQKSSKCLEMSSYWLLETMKGAFLTISRTGGCFEALNCESGSLVLERKEGRSLKMGKRPKNRKLTHGQKWGKMPQNGIMTPILNFFVRGAIMFPSDRPFPQNALKVLFLFLKKAKCRVQSSLKASFVRLVDLFHMYCFHFPPIGTVVSKIITPEILFFFRINLARGNLLRG